MNNQEITGMDDNQLLRYSRQIMLPDIDINGQEKLLAAKVLIVGMGGLGCPVAMYLASAGTGTLAIADSDEVDLTNLQRQIAHTTEDIGRFKVDSALDTIKSLNPDTRVIPINERLEGEALVRRIESSDVVVDASDNFSTRFAVNEACVKSGTPLVSGAAIQMEGQITVVDPSDRESGCYRCLYEEADDAQFSCSENGVLAPIVGIIGAMQALETIKVIVGFGQTLSGHLMLLDAISMQWQKFKLDRNPNCPICCDASI